MRLLWRFLREIWFSRLGLSSFMPLPPKTRLLTIDIIYRGVEALVISRGGRRG